MTHVPYTKLDQPEVLAVLFHPAGETTPAPPGTTDFDIPVADGISVNARFHPADQDAPNILFFHGNGETVCDYDTIGPMFNQVGLGFLVVDYRGYGKSGGTPAATDMLCDAHTVFREVRKLLAAGNMDGPLVVMGRSLGSAAALELTAAYQEEITALIIESGFADTVPLLATLGLDPGKLGITEADGFHNVRKIQRVTKPTLILHAQNDEIIPLQSAGLLQAECAARAKELQIVPGADHNTIIAVAGRMYFQVIKGFIDKVLKKRGTRRYRK